MERKLVLNFVAFVGKLGSEFIPDGPFRVEMVIGIYVDFDVSVPVSPSDRGFVVPCNRYDQPVEVAEKYNDSKLTVDDVFDVSLHEGLLRISLTQYARDSHQISGQYWQIAKLEHVD